MDDGGGGGGGGGGVARLVREEGDLAATVRQKRMGRVQG